MTIRDVEERTGLTRANIRYYEQEGLLHPRREANGYRDYGEEDVNTLGRIKLLRQLGVSIEQLRALQSGELELAAVLTQAQTELEQQQAENEEAQALCRRLQRDAVSYHTLDAEKYTKEAETPRPSVWDSIITRDAERPITNIWRRYFARMLDFALYRAGLDVLLGVGLRITITLPQDSFWNALLASVLLTWMVMVLMLVLEPLWLHLWGTTPGKFIFGLHLEQEDGSRPSYAQGFDRTLRVLWYGMGLGIPVLDLVFLIKRAWHCTDGEEMPWERDGVAYEAELYYSIRDEKRRRFLAAAGVYVLAVLLSTIAGMYPQTPPNRGDLTPEELVENYNYYRAKLHVGLAALEYHNGELRPRYLNYVNLLPDDEPVVQVKFYDLTVEDGVVTGITLRYAGEGAFRHEDGHVEEQLLWTLSLAGAQKSVGLFSDIRHDVAEYVAANAVSDYVYTVGDFELRNDVTYSGYEQASTSYLYSEDDDYSFEQVVTIRRR